MFIKNPDGIGIAVLHVDETYSFDKEKTSSRSLWNK